MVELKEKLWSSLYSIVKMGGIGKGKHFWVYVPTGEKINCETVGCNSELWGKAKHDKEVYTKGGSIPFVDCRFGHYLGCRL